MSLEIFDSHTDIDAILAKYGARVEIEHWTETVDGVYPEEWVIINPPGAMILNSTHNCPEETAKQAAAIFCVLCASGCDCGFAIEVARRFINCPIWMDLYHYALKQN